MQYTLSTRPRGCAGDGGGRARADGSFAARVDPAISAALFLGLYQLFIIAASSDIAQLRSNGSILKSVCS